MSEKGRPDRFVGYPDEYDVIHPDTQEIIKIADSQDAIDQRRREVWDGDRLEAANTDEDGFPATVHHRTASGSDNPCSTCSYFGDRASFCEMYDAPTSASDTCDSWTNKR